MNLVGKIFTVLIFVMSIFFMTMALMVYATHKNWRDVVLAKGGLKEQLTQVKTERDDLTTARDKLQKDLDDLKGGQAKGNGRVGERNHVEEPGDQSSASRRRPSLRKPSAKPSPMRPRLWRKTKRSTRK